MPSPPSDEVRRALGLSREAIFSSAPQGMTSEVVFVADGERRLVLKRCRSPIYIDWLRREHRVLRALESLPLRMPRAVAYHERDASDTWLLMTRLPGRSFWEVLLNADPPARARQLRTLGTLLRDLHATAPPPALASGGSWVDRQLEAARRNLAWCDGSPELLARLHANRPAPQRETLIHGDLALDNVLIDADGSMSLIDWAGGDVGDPRYDIALALATEPELQLSDSEVAAFFDGYGSAPLPDATRRWFAGLYEFF
jgi:aminoglycoside phosphotransferase (APT) family kinase protein